MTVNDGPIVLVTGATGNVGLNTLKMLLRDPDLTSEKYRIRAACYHNSKHVDTVRHLQGIDRVYEIDADVCNVDLEEAFRGAEYVFVVTSSSRKRVQHVKNYVEAAKRAGSVKFLALLSLVRPEEGKTRMGNEFREMEDIVEKELADTNIKYSFVRTGMLNSTLFMFAPDIRKGVLPLPIKDGRVAMLDERDLGCFMAKVFLNPDRHASKAYHLTGPEVLSGQEMAAIASRALGRDVRYINVSLSNAKKLMTDSGKEEWLADGFNGIFEEIAKNHYAFETSDLIKSETGCHPTTLLDFFRDHGKRFTTTAEEAEIVPPPAVETLKKGKQREERRHYEGGRERGADVVESALRDLKTIRQQVTEIIQDLEEEAGGK